MIPKFRAWDKEHDELLYPDDVDKIYFELTVDGIVTYDMRYILPYDDIPPCLDAVIMQSTGLHDKNGKEIFEGDIVNITGIYDHKIMCEVVEYCKHGAYYDVGSFMLGNFETHHIEIIGNVHEHSGLLKENDE